MYLISSFIMLTNTSNKLFLSNTSITLNFLDVDKKYKAKIYKDGADADWEKNPKSYLIEEKTVSSKDKLKLKLAPGGGVAISFEVK